MELRKWWSESKEIDIKTVDRVHHPVHPCTSTLTTNVSVYGVIEIYTENTFAQILREEKRWQHKNYAFGYEKQAEPIGLSFTVRHFTFRTKYRFRYQIRKTKTKMKTNVNLSGWWAHSTEKLFELNNLRFETCVRYTQSLFCITHTHTHSDFLSFAASNVLHIPWLLAFFHP